MADDRTAPVLSGWRLTDGRVVGTVHGHRFLPDGGIVSATVDEIATDGLWVRTETGLFRLKDRLQ